MTINKTLFRKIRNKILRVPEAYDQSRWGDEARTPCGTKACIAGHALIEDGFCTPQELNRANGLCSWEDGYVNIEETARKLLGLSPNAASRVFDADGEGWAEPYETRFREAKTKEAKARVAADYINHIIRTGKVR